MFLFLFFYTSAPENAATQQCQLPWLNQVIKEERGEWVEEKFFCLVILQFIVYFISSVLGNRHLYFIYGNICNAKAGLGVLSAYKLRSSNRRHSLLTHNISYITCCVVIKEAANSYFSDLIAKQGQNPRILFKTTNSGAQLSQPAESSTEKREEFLNFFYNKMVEILQHINTYREFIDEDVQRFPAVK